MAIERSHRLGRPTTSQKSKNVVPLRRSVGQACLENPSAYKRTEGKCTGARVRFKMDNSFSSLFPESEEDEEPDRDPA